MFDIYKYDRRLLDDYMGICNDLETALQSFDTLYSDIYAAFEALLEKAEDIEERINICSMRLGPSCSAAGRTGLRTSGPLRKDYAMDIANDWIAIDDEEQLEFPWQSATDP